MSICQADSNPSTLTPRLGGGGAQSQLLEGVRFGEKNIQTEGNGLTWVPPKKRCTCTPCFRRENVKRRNGFFREIYRDFISQSVNEIQ